MRFKNNLSSRINLINLFRELWQEHIIWTRSFIVSTVSGLNDLEFVTNRLLRNPTDFANVLKLYYGVENAKIFEKLFSEHLKLAASLINNLLKGNMEAAEHERRNWYKNADEILDFLNKLSPYMSIKKFQTLFYHHLKAVEDSFHFRFTDHYGQEIINFDVMQSEAMKMADIMSNAILDQFYNR